MKRADPYAAPGTTGRVLHQAGFYDWVVSLAMFGRERTFRENVLDLARLVQGETVLDIGCGTGTLAIAAKRRVGARGAVHAIDASAEMIARAQNKARKSRAEIHFENAVSERLPFPDAGFDVVLSTLMLHHLPAKARVQSIQEIRRVLRPGGRLLVVDFENDGAGHGPLRHMLHRRHGHVKADAVRTLLEQSGFRVVQSGVVGLGNMHFTLATIS